MKPLASRSFTCFSGFLLHSMYQFARASQEVERELNPKREAENRSFVLGALMSSVTFLESHINELFLLAKEDDGTMHYSRLESSARLAMTNLWDDVASKLGILAKYDLVLALNGRDALDHGAAPYQDADALVRLRNAVVHYQTGFREHPDPEPLKLEKRLHGKFEPCAYYQRTPGPLFPHRCLGAGCAVWAVKAAREFADEFHAKLGVRGVYQSLQNIPILL